MEGLGEGAFLAELAGVEVWQRRKPNNDCGSWWEAAGTKDNWDDKENSSLVTTSIVGSGGKAAGGKDNSDNKQSNAAVGRDN